jgi:hypothetical protein
MVHAIPFPRVEVVWIILHHLHPIATVAKNIIFGDAQVEHLHWINTVG